jgi:FkbM family methyltransferase
MARFYDILKSQALRRLPDAWLGALKARHYFRMLKNFNTDDEPDMKVVPLLVPAGTTAVDLGANVGVYTKLLSELVGVTGSVVSVEPVPETYAILRENVRRLRLGNVSLVDAAVSDSTGTATMTIPEYPSGGHNFYESQIIENDARTARVGSSRTVTVRTTTLDLLVADLSAVSFIKCDVEGHEGAVISGAGALLQGQRPAWLIEISENPDTAGTTASLLFETLTASGYAAWFFDGAKLRSRKSGDRSTNYFFLTPAHVARIVGEAPTLIAPS